MARNEEKQQGRLNRLWLQKEREEGRIKDVHQRRPKLSTLNSAPSVKKWIPSIKNEIEYYLQQSQLSHYPDRKIAEFQLQIEALEKEYKSFLSKLRALDPSCKDKPWTPRAYSKRRADTEASPAAAKTARPCESFDGSRKWSRDWSDATSSCSETDTKAQTPVPTEPISHTSAVSCADQDQPLAFDHTKLAVAAAAFRGRSVRQGFSQSQCLASVLQSGLPNIVNASLRKTVSTQRRDAEDSGRAMTATQDCKSDCEAADRMMGEKTPSTDPTGEGIGHVLGLDCYSSSGEESDA